MEPGPGRTWDAENESAFTHGGIPATWRDTNRAEGC